jgi:hypothetical protein
VLPDPRGGGAGIAGKDGMMFSEGGSGTCFVGCREGGGGGGGGRFGRCLAREALRAREEERGGTLPGAMLYILE